MGQVSLTLMDDKPVGPLKKQDFYIWIDFFLSNHGIKGTCTLHHCTVYSAVVQAKVKSSLGMSKNSKTWWTKNIMQ